MNLHIFTDGGARGNPGPAAIGIVIQDEEGKMLARFGKKIGETTNNVAEYMAVIEALEWIKNNFQSPGSNFQFSLDSKLVVNQLNGLFKIKEPHLRELLLRIRELEGEVGSQISYQLIPREKNWTADLLVNQALDS